MDFERIILMLVIVLLAYIIVIYNRFASLRAGIDTSWADIQVQVKRRDDLMLSLIDRVKNYKDYEEKTLENIIEVKQEGLGQVFALLEAYPELNSDNTFVKLQEKLASLEDALHSKRRSYNTLVRDYNHRLETLPDLLIARRFNYVSCEYFSLEFNVSSS